MVTKSKVLDLSPNRLPSKRCKSKAHRGKDLHPQWKRAGGGQGGGTEREKLVCLCRNNSLFCTAAGSHMGDYAVWQQSRGTERPNTKIDKRLKQTRATYRRLIKLGYTAVHIETRT